MPEPDEQLAAFQRGQDEIAALVPKIGTLSDDEWLNQPLYGTTRRQVYIGWLESLRRWVRKQDRLWDGLPDYEADTAEDELRSMCSFLAEMLQEKQEG